MRYLKYGSAHNFRMSFAWDKMFIGLDRSNNLFLGRGKIGKDGVIQLEERSDDKTFEILSMVGKMMRKNLDKREDKRPWVGYDIPLCGKLVLIKPGFDFETFRVRKDMVTRPLRDF